MKPIDPPKDSKTELIFCKESDTFKKLAQLTKVNRQDAKIFAFNTMDGWNSQSPTKTLVFLTTKPNNVSDTSYFNITIVHNTYSVNRNGMIYVKAKEAKSIIFKNKQAWIVDNSNKKKIKPAFIGDLLSLTILSQYNVPDDIIIKIRNIVNTIPYLNTFKQYGNLNAHLTYNHAIRNKILTPKDRITYALGGIKGEKIIECMSGNIEAAIQLVMPFIGSAKRIKPYIHLIDDSKINHEILQNPTTLLDTLRMASVFNATIKLRWSPKRLKALHDELAKTITVKAAELAKVDFTIPKLIKDFNKFINENSYFKSEIIPDSKSLAIHGMDMHHCVATYANRVQAGYCYILTVKDKNGEVWTAEIDSAYHVNFNVQSGESKPYNRISLRQFLGVGNKAPDAQIKKDFEDCINNFNTFNVILSQSVQQEKQPQRIQELEFQGVL